MRFLRSKFFVVLLICVVIAILLLSLTHSRQVDYATEVKPILNRHCINCHGGVKQKGGFGVLFREDALAKTENGRYGIVPGDASASEMIRRLTLKDPEERMPYRHDPLNSEDIETLRKWVDQGAHWGTNWSYASLSPVEVPKPHTFFGLFPATSNWARNEIDYFIEDKMRTAGMTPSPEAEKSTLLRRVSLDLIGMPAPKWLADRFMADNSEKAYDLLVDSLLASPHFGEKWASFWLDIARYADTKGYERDSRRNIYEYRDWVIRAFNRDMPYNDFLTQQIAGDLLPNPTYDNYIASAFQRNTMTNDEGGTNNEEFRTAAVIDRVNSTWQGLLGTTFACVQCHSHPYDPFRHDEYYKFMAFYNDTRDEDTEADYPWIRKFDDSLNNELQLVKSWVSANGGAAKANGTETFVRTWQPSFNSLTCDSFTNSELVDTKWLGVRDKAACRLKHVWLQDRNEFIYHYQAWSKGGTLKLHIDRPDGPVIARIALEPNKGDWGTASSGLVPSQGYHDIWFTYMNPGLKLPEQTGAMFDWFYFGSSFPGSDKPGYAEMKSRYWNLLTADVKGTPVMMDNPSFMHRPTHVFERGNWRVKGKEVTPAVPASLNPIPAGAPKNRLGLAAWLTSDQNPLTARTMVNHVWEQIFGIGLAETLEDLGSQGAPPTHRELLDWLSYEYINADKWSTKKLIRKIVTSATYRQSSALSAELLKKDPTNRLYCRFPRVRLSAEQVRDQALCISGLVNEKMFGPGVFPYQPSGIWLSPWNGDSWEQNTDDDQFRRAIYTFWKRSAAYPSMMAFDAVSREVCTARRIRTNTPLQALTTLNDPAYVDIARHFAKRMQQQAGNDPQKQIAWAYLQATFHKADERSMEAMLKLYQAAVKKFAADSAKTRRFVTDSLPASANFAAMTIVANAMLNLDEVVMKN